jgi:acyl carrier protein
MTPTRAEVYAYVVETLQDLARDWDYSRPVDSHTRLFSELGFESLDAVVLGAAIQDHYHRAMPFAELLAQLGQTGSDLTVGALVDFVQRHAGVAVEDAV